MTLLAQFAATGGGVANYIEDVFSTYLYTGNGATNQTITNGIDLSTKGGLVWIKNRPTTPSHFLSDSGSNFASYMSSNATTANTSCSSFFAATTSGFTLTGAGGGLTNNTGDGYVSWTFRKQPKFFDVVTYTGNGTNRSIAHALGSVPGCIMVKRTDTTGDWQVYHRSISNTEYLVLNSTAPKATGTNRWNSTDPTSTVFTVGTDATVNASGGTYVAYVFAHDAGGFGLSGAENVISCGTGTWNGSGVSSVTLGYEPQWVMIKASTGTAGWWMVDNMRGMPATNDGAQLNADLDIAENTASSLVPRPTATGFTTGNGLASNTYIYIAIRRGPMKVPTTGTSVFSPNLAAAQGQLTTGFPVDLGMWNYRTGYSENTVVNDRLRGVSSTNSVTNANNLITSSNAAEAASQGTRNWNNTGLYAVSGTAVFYSFGRAPGFFDEVCYTGTGSAQALTHNLAAVPELMIVKRRTSGTGDFWFVYSASTGNTIYLALNSTGKTEIFSGIWNDTTPTSTQFTIGSYTSQSAAPYVAYLFATCAGVSKVGSYTGTGTTQTINCGFTAGSRFVMIKRTDASGDWYVWDSARGIIAGNDPYLLFNSIAAEVTSTDYIDTSNAGFQISDTAPAAINANGGSFIFLAIS